MMNYDCQRLQKLTIEIGCYFPIYGGALMSEWTPTQQYNDISAKCKHAPTIFV